MFGRRIHRFDPWIHLPNINRSHPILGSHSNVVRILTRELSCPASQPLSESAAKQPVGSIHETSHSFRRRRRHAGPIRRHEAYPDVIRGGRRPGNAPARRVAIPLEHREKGTAPQLFCASGGQSRRLGSPFLFLMANGAFWRYDLLQRSCGPAFKVMPLPRGLTRRGGFSLLIWLGVERHDAIAC